MKDTIKDLRDVSARLATLARATNNAADVLQALDEKKLAIKVLPDGSGFCHVSLHLPSDHWLYQNVNDTPPWSFVHPTSREALRDAARWAICRTTNSGIDMDFDPDAIVQNLLFAVFGPADETVPEEVPAPGSVWTHLGGKLYTVILVTNTNATSEDFPATVVYRDETHTWSRPLSDWLRVMKRKL